MDQLDDEAPIEIAPEKLLKIKSYKIKYEKNNELMRRKDRHLKSSKDREMKRPPRVRFRKDTRVKDNKRIRSDKEKLLRSLRNQNKKLISLNEQKVSDDSHIVNKGGFFEGAVLSVNSQAVAASLTNVGLSMITKSRKKRMLVMKNTLIEVCEGFDNKVVVGHFQNIFRMKYMQVFNGKNLGRAADTFESQGLSMNAIEMVRKLENVEKEYMKRLFPCKSTVGRKMKQLTAGVASKIEQTVSDDSLQVVLNIQNIFTEIIIGKHLASRGRTDEQIRLGDLPEVISISLATDGGKLNAARGFELVGLKLNDVGHLKQIQKAEIYGGVNKKRSISKNKAEAREKVTRSVEYALVQSVRAIIPIGFSIGGESYECLKKLLGDSGIVKFIESLHLKLWKNPINNLNYQFMVSMAQDKKSANITTCKGGGIHLKLHFCVYGSCRNDSNVEIGGMIICPLCSLHGLTLMPVRQLDDSYKEIEIPCRHHQTLTDANTRDIKEARFPYIQFPNKNANVATLKFFVEDTLKCTQSEYAAVEHLAGGNGPKLSKMISNFKSQCLLSEQNVETIQVTQLDRNYSILGVNYEELEKEYLASDFAKTLIKKIRELPIFRQVAVYLLCKANDSKYVNEYNSDLDPILLITALAILCLLHMEMRVGEKLISLLLNDCFRGKITEIQGNAKIETITLIINGALDGSIVQIDDDNGDKLDLKLEFDDRKASGNHFRIYDENKTIHFKISCVRQRKVREVIRLIIDKVFEDQNDPASLFLKKNYIDLFNVFDTLMLVYRQETNFTDEEILNAHHISNRFGHMYILMFTKAKVTNYIHDIIAGHCTFFLQTYKNLYRFAQIGFECGIGLFRNNVNKRQRSGFNIAKQTGDYMMRIAAYRQSSIQDSEGEESQILKIYYEAGEKLYKQKQYGKKKKSLEKDENLTNQVELLAPQIELPELCCLPCEDY